jgi:hypothetical protein
MRLTNSDKKAFVHSVMGDVPKVDYDALANDLVMKQVVAKLPKQIRDIWGNTELRGFIKCDVHRALPSPLHYTCTPPADWSCDADTKSKLDELAKNKEVQRKTHNDLESKVSSVIAGCTTLKQAAERLPEFAKYLPEDRDGFNTKDLPVVSNVVADLVKAGWPKKTKRGSK